MQIGLSISYTQGVATRLGGSLPENAAPVINGAPEISGTPVVGAVLTAIPAPATGVPAPARTWQWHRSGAPVSGETQSVYTLTVSDVDHTITVQQTETNTAGNDSATSPETIEIAETISSFDPSIRLRTQRAGSNGTPDNIAVTYGYTGTDIVDLYAATGAAGFAISAPQLIAQSGGGAVEFDNHPDYQGLEIDLNNLTDDSVTELAILAVERHNGGSSGIQRAALIDIDFSAPQLLSAEVGNVNSDTLRVTFSEALYGSVSSGDWALSSNTIASVNLTPGDAFVDLTLSATAISGDDYADELSFSGSSLTDARGNPLASFSDQGVANNVAAGGASLTFLSSPPASTTSYGAAASGPLFTAVIPAAGDYLIGLNAIKREDSAAPYINVTGVITAATEIATSGSAPETKWFYCTASAAGDVNVRNSQSSTQVQATQIHIFEAVGLTPAGVIVASDIGPSSENPPSATLSNVPNGYFMAAAFIHQSEDATDLTWSAGLTEHTDTTFSSGSHNISVASGQKSGLGDQIVEVAVTGGGGGEFALSAIALDTV